nr:hypothetical protein [uncultured Tolumonas sp.]
MAKSVIPTVYLYTQQPTHSFTMAKSSKTQCVTNFPHAIRTLRRENEKIHIWLVAPPSESLQLYQLAIEKKLEGIIVEDKRFKLSASTCFERALAQCTLSHNEDDVLNIIEELVEEALFLTPVKVAYEEMLATLRTAAPAIHIQQSPANEFIEATFKERFNERKQQIKRFISVAPDNPNVTFITVSYGPELISQMIDNPGVYCLVAPMGSGKTRSVILPFFEHQCENGRYPLLAGAKRILMGSLVNDDRHYKKARHLLVKHPDGQSPLPVTGTAGVINTLFHDDFTELRAHSDTLLIEEYEDVQSHLVSSAIGVSGKLRDQAKLKNQLNDQIKKSRYVVIADAMLSDFSANELAKISGQPIYICHPATINEVKPNQILYYRSESLLIEKLHTLLADEGKNIFTFSDCANNENKSHFLTLANLFNKAARTAFIIDRRTSNTDDDMPYESLLKNLDAELKKYQHVLVSPMINSGVSIQNQHFSEVAALGYRTLMPNQLIQTLKRVRDAERIHLHLNLNTTSDPALFFTRDELLTSAIAQDHKGNSNTKRLRQNYINDPATIAILDRMLFENEMRIDHANTVLTILEHLGYEIVYQPSDKKKEKRGSELLKVAEHEEAINKQNTLTTATKQKKETATYLEAKNTLSQFYKVVTPEIPQDIVDFDNKGKGRKILTAMKYARQSQPKSDDITISEAANYKFMKKLLSLLNVDPTTLTGKFNSNDVKICVNWLATAKMEQEDFEQNVSAILDKNTLNLKPGTSQKYSLSTIKRLFKENFELTIEKLDRPGIDGVRVYMYQLQETEISRKAEMYYQMIYSHK